jgi:hypothetical protein
VAVFEGGLRVTVITTRSTTVVLGLEQLIKP